MLAADSEDLDFSSLFELSEGDTLLFTSPESYEYESDSDLDDDENNLAVVQPVAELSAGVETSTRRDQQSHTSVHDAQLHEGLCLFPLVKL